MAQLMTQRKRARGFTLIELMIVVAIIAIIATIAVPAYQEQIRKARRAGAQSFMQTVASKQEQFLVASREYATTVSALGLTTAAAEHAAHYTFAINTATPAPLGFTVTATPTATGTQMIDGALSLDSKGVKTPLAKW